MDSLVEENNVTTMITMSITGSGITVEMVTVPAYMVMVVVAHITKAIIVVLVSLGGMVLMVLMEK